jgi:xanthine dehydrogenase YagS FAD-binding subunit
LHDVEAALVGAPATDATYARAAEIASRGMRGFGKNDFKIPLSRNAVHQALQTVGGMA